MTEHLRDPSNLSVPEIEAIERQSLRSLYQAVIDFGFEAYDIFQHSTDNVTEIGEDITREILDRLGGYHIQQRIYGNVDYRKARYVILPDYLVRQALFVDSKAEKSARTATLQMSQTSLTINQFRAGGTFAEVGKLPAISQYHGDNFLTTTLLAHYFYHESGRARELRTINVAAVPNGRLQHIYNPNPEDTIWLAGRNAPIRNEDFRVRLAFDRLRAKATWRVQSVLYHPFDRIIESGWNEDV